MSDKELIADLVAKGHHYLASDTAREIADALERVATELEAARAREKSLRTWGNYLDDQITKAGYLIPEVRAAGGWKDNAFQKAWRKAAAESKDADL